MLQAVDQHQELLRASVANAGQDHRLGANEAPPAIISVFLGAELEKVFNALESGSDDAATPASSLQLGASVLPHLPKHGGDRNRTSPFAFTGNKFEFRALGSSMSLSLPNTVLNTIAAEAIDDLAAKIEELKDSAGSVESAVLKVVKEAWTAHKRIVFDGDGYSDEWHAEAAVARPGEPAPDAGRASVDRRAAHGRGVRALRRALRARARGPLRGARRAVHDAHQHRGRDRGLDGADDAAAAGDQVVRRARRGDRQRGRRDACARSSAG